MPFVFGWLLNGVYLLFLTAVAPLLIFRRVAHGKYRRGWNEKLTGRLQRQSAEKRCLWFHAVSVGEVLQLQTLLEKMEIRFPDAELFVTVTTETGYDVAKSKYPRYTVSFFPLDFSWAVHRALRAIQPDVIVLVELELWPNLIFAARQQRIPLVLANGRIGEKSHRGYSRLRPLMKRLLWCFDVLASQTDVYADRLKSLGAPPDRVIVTGNIKFDRAESDRQNPKTMELRSCFGLNESDVVFIAGSTQDPEESYAIDAWLTLRRDFPHLKLIVVPRHKERFEEVATLIRQRGCDVIRRSERKDSSGPAVSSHSYSGKPVAFLLDTLGELAACWGLADVAFVGGSLTNRGGQNMIEPAAYGAAVLFGPNTWNFKDITEALLSREAARVVTGPEDLLNTVRELLQKPEEIRRLGESARSFVLTQHGATERTVELIANVVRDQTRSSSSLRDKPVAPSRSGILWPLLKCLLFGLVFVFVGRRAIQLWESAPDKSIQIQWPWLLASSLFYFLGWLPSAWFWRALLIQYRQPLDWWTALRAYYVGHIGKYVPGKALVLVIRGAMVKDKGVDPILAGITAAYETLVFMATGAALCLAVAPYTFSETARESLPAWMRGGLHPTWLFPALVAVLTFATTPMSAWLFSKIAQKSTSRDQRGANGPPSISARLISQGIAITSVGWICHALSLGCVIRAVSESPFELSQFPIWLAACSLSTVGGFVVLIAPGGLGVREGLLIEFLKDQPQIGPSTAVIAAGLLRAVWFFTELVVGAILYFLKPRVGKPSF